jgi:uncharacterized LabA/DUF88 family protein
MPLEPATKRVTAFFDGQNLFYAAKAAFGYSWPNYDPLVLARRICKQQGSWDLCETYFYTGIPSISYDRFWHHFWTAKLAVMGTRKIHSFSRNLKYRNQTVKLPGGLTTTVLVGQEKGIDVRIALDIVRMAREMRYDVALVFSQDQDLSEVADEIKKISFMQNRWIKMVCAFPVSPTSDNTRGINSTEWIKIDRKLYDACLDPLDYRLKT